MKNVIVTLGQLIAVVIILFILVIFFYPWGGKPRDKARQITCASNEKQLGLAITQYVQDNDFNYPNIAEPKDPKTTWRNMVYDYTKSYGMYLCPSRGENLPEQGEKPATPDGLPDSYAANYTGDYSGSAKDWGQGVFAGAGSKPLNEKDIPDSASIIMLCETWHNSRGEFNIDNLGAFNPTSDMLWAGHSDGSNYLFADGHDKYLKPLATKDMWHRDSSIPLSAGAIKVLGNAHKDDR